VFLSCVCLVYGTEGADILYCGHQEYSSRQLFHFTPITWVLSRDSVASEVTGRGSHVSGRLHDLNWRR
jgi:hypothetical protein